MALSIWERVAVNAETIQPGPLLDPRSLRIYAIILFWMVVCAFDLIPENWIAWS